MKGQDAERLAGVLAHCTLILAAIMFLEAAGEQNLAGVLEQCRELVHLNLSGYRVVFASSAIAG